jgi:SET domain-containing protein
MIRDIAVRVARAKGKGVFPLRSFQKGEFIFRRRYERVIAAQDLDVLPEDERCHLCELGFDRFAVLAAPGCYLNHACDPNAMRHGVSVFAWRDIAAGEEITIDYRLNAFDDEVFRCVCGSPSCTGQVVNSFFALDEARQVEYLPHAPAFIRAEFRRWHAAR